MTGLFEISNPDLNLSKLNFSKSCSKLVLLELDRQKMSPLKTSMDIHKFNTVSNTERTSSCELQKNYGSFLNN